MNTHFLHTAGGFSYPYYLAVLSALHTQRGTVTVWTATTGKYLGVLQKTFPDRLRVQPLPTPFNSTPPALVGKPDYWAHAHIKDYLIWVVLAAHGGLCLDLDTFCLADCSDLLGEKQLMLPMDYPTPDGSTHPYNSAIVAAMPDSPLAQTLRDEAFRRLHRSPGDFPWGTTGPILVSEMAQQHPEAVATPAFRVCGGFGGLESRALFEGTGSVSTETRVIHLFAQYNCAYFPDITPDSLLSGAHLLAATVRRWLTGCELIPLPSWNVADWLRMRGTHYAAMFRYLRTHNCRAILETGTNNGSNAVGMIRTSLTPEADVHYYGFDLFQPHDANTQAIEFSQGYHNPPPCAQVLADLQRQTTAHIHLFAGDSKVTLPQAAPSLPPIDFAYVDGGHSLATTAADFAQVQRLLAPGGIIFLDDYFSQRRDVGCAPLVDGLDRSRYLVNVYPELDNYQGNLQTQLVSVQQR